MSPSPAAPETRRPTKWAKLIDQTSCIGCHACSTACKSENEVPLSVNRTYVKYVDAGVFPHTRRAFQVTRCNQCDDAPCVTACPTTAMYKRPDGIVDFVKTVCIGCKACIAACPYDAIFINPEDQAAEKCNFCAHRIDSGLEPACVVVCPTESILIGDLNDPQSKVAQIVAGEAVAVRRPEKKTEPKLYYKGADPVTLDPLAALRPAGGLFMWSEQGDRNHGQISSGNPRPAMSSAAAVLAYDVPHTAPWGWKVSLYTWTKSIAAGVYLAIVLLALTGTVSWRSPVWTLGVPMAAGAFLAVTGWLLIWDLKHPERFYLIFTRPQWGSWLVRGAFIIGGYAALLLVHLAAALMDEADLVKWLAVMGVPLAAMTAAYTAYLFAQARARDLWQSAILPAHFLVQALVAGAAVMLGVALVLDSQAVAPLAWLLSVSSLAHLALVMVEAVSGEPTAHAKLARWELTSGTFGGYLKLGAGLALAGALAPWIGAIALPLALAGLMAYEHAYVQAGQIVPLA